MKQHLGCLKMKSERDLEDEDIGDKQASKGDYVND